MRTPKAQTQIRPIYKILSFAPHIAINCPLTVVNCQCIVIAESEVIDMKIQIKHRQAYGRDLFDVTDETQQRAWSQLSGKQTVTVDDIEHLRTLGAEVEVLPADIPTRK